MALRLITEEIKNVKTEKNDFWYITGPFIQSGIVNGNNRIYPYSIAKPEVERYIVERIKTHRALGELNHPPTPEINPKEASHIVISLDEKIIDLERGICNWVGKARILNTPNGKIAQALLEGGVQLAVSSRALGSLKEIGGINEVQSDFRLCTPADIVFEPSAPDAFVSGILENKAWVVDGQGFLREQLVETYKKELNAQSASHIKKNMIKHFHRFLSTL